jgi:sugar transferase (PEP-CTERM/EpsH1 system associated)
MKVLVLDEEFPYPSNTGKRTRSFNLYRRLGTQFQIRYIGYGEEGSAAAEALKLANLEPVAVPARIPSKQGAFFYLRLLANLVSPLPYIVTSHYSHIYQNVVLKNISEFRPDLIICEWTPYVIYVKQLEAVKKLVSAHNVEADIWQRYYENETNCLRRWYIREQWRKVERFEREALNWVDGAVTVSDLDRNRLFKKQPNLPITTIPNGVDLEYFRPMPQAEQRHQLVFTGSMDWRPNQDATHFFVREILPLLRRVRPELECTFVGRSPPTDIQLLAELPGVHITGTVDDVRPYVERSAVYVVPLRIGGGSRLKILEALAMGRPVVATTVGAEGLNVVHDQQILLANDPATFADSVLRLLDDPAQCVNLAAEGRRLVEQIYGWDSLAKRFARLIQEVVGRKKQAKDVVFTFKRT